MPICINELFKNSYGQLRNVYFVLSKLQLNCYKKVVFVFILVLEYVVKVKVLVAHI